MECTLEFSAALLSGWPNSTVRATHDAVIPLQGEACEGSSLQHVRPLPEAADFLVFCSF